MEALGFLNGDPADTGSQGSIPLLEESRGSGLVLDGAVDGNTAVGQML